MSETILSITIRKAGYKDEKETISNINFQVQKGEIVGLIGSNGAGKSTTMKAILDMLPIFDGEVKYSSDQQRYSYIPEHPTFYEELTLWEHLEFASSVCQLSSAWKNRADELLYDFKMTHVVHHLPTSFSKGMQQKLMIIVALLTEPSLYIIDEPFIGLDPNSMNQLINHLQREKERGAGIVMSTHVLDTAERYCDRFLLIESGSIVAEGSLDQIRTLANRPRGTLLDCFDEIMWGGKNGAR